MTNLPKSPSRAENDAAIREYRALVSQHGAESPIARAAAWAIAWANARLVASFIDRYTHRAKSLTSQDLFMAGLIGLVRGIETFDPDRGFGLSTYVLWWVRHAIGRSLQDLDRMVRVPVHAQEALHRRQTGKPHTGRPEVLEAALGAIQRPTSLDAPLGEDGNGTWGDLLAADVPEDDVGDPQLLARLRDALSTFTPAERRSALSENPPEELLGRLRAMLMGRQLIQRDGSLLASSASP